MQSDFKPGARVRVKGAEPIGTVESNTEGYVSVRYDHRPGVFTLGYYPESHLEVVPPESREETKDAKASKVRPAASVKDILPQPVTSTP